MIPVPRSFPNLLSGLRLALEAGPLAGLAPLLGSGTSLPEGISPGQALDQLTQEIAGRDEALAGRLVSLSGMASHSVHPSELVAAWRQYTALVAEAPRHPMNAEGPAARFQALRETLDLANDPERRMVWLKESLAATGFSDPDWILAGSPPLQGRRSNRIYLLMDRGNDDLFHLDVEAISSRKIMISVQTPAEGKPLSKADLRHLIARAFLLQAAEPLVGEKWARGVRSFRRASLAKVPPATVFKEDGSIPLGSGSLTPETRSLALTHEWLNDASRVAASVGFAESLRDREDANDEFLRRQRFWLRDHLGEDVYKNADQSWIDLVRTRNFSKTAFLSGASLLRSPMRTILSAVPGAGRSPSLEISLGTYGKQNALVMVRGARDVFEGVTADDLFDVVWRVFAGREDREFQRTKRESVSLAEIRSGKGLSKEALAQRAYLKLVLDFHRSRKSAAAENPEGEEAIRIEGVWEGLSKKVFARVLTAIQRQQEMTSLESVSVAWDEVMGVRRWFLGESGEAAEHPIVEVTPLGKECLLYVKGSAGRLSALDWLFLLGTMAANPDQAIRACPGRKEVITGRLGDAQDLYAGIAANRIFAPFGTYDPAARLPQNVDLALPKGVPASANPFYAASSSELKRAYLKALRWFGASDVPPEWQPAASDDFETARSKFRRMMSAWHPDKGSTAEQVNLVSHSMPHWKALLSLYGG